MGLFAIDVECQTCKEVRPQLVERDAANDDHVCELCGEKALRTFSVPNNTRKSFVDGTKREGFDKMKKAIKVEKAMMNLPPHKRGEHKKEIAALRKVEKK